MSETPLTESNVRLFDALKHAVGDGNGRTMADLFAEQGIDGHALGGALGELWNGFVEERLEETGDIERALPLAALDVGFAAFRAGREFEREGVANG